MARGLHLPSGVLKFEMGPGPAIRSPHRRARVTLPIFRVRRTILRPSRMPDLRPKNSLRNFGVNPAPANIPSALATRACTSKHVKSVS